MANQDAKDWRESLSPFKLTSLMINAVCFGACVVLLLLTRPSGPLVLLTIGTGFSTLARGISAVKAARRMRGEAVRAGRL